MMQQRPSRENSRFLRATARRLRYPLHRWAVDKVVGLGWARAPPPPPRHHVAVAQVTPPPPPTGEPPGSHPCAHATGRRLVGRSPRRVSLLTVWTRLGAPAWVPPGEWPAAGDATAGVATPVHGVTSRAQWRGPLLPLFRRADSHCRTPTGGSPTVTPRPGPSTAVPTRTIQPCVVPHHA